MSSTPPQNPAGPWEPSAAYSDSTRRRLQAALEAAPAELRAVVDGLSKEQLATRYRNWSIRQIVHHLADSHVHSYVRFKWTLTEEHPTIKAYDEGLWAEFADAKQAEIEPSLALLEAIHQRWRQTLQAMSEGDFERRFHHPESGEDPTLWQMLSYYAWHGRHHTAQIHWVRSQNDWAT